MIRHPLLACFLLLVSVNLFATEHYTSVFHPPVRAAAQESLLLEDDQYDELGETAEGLQTPFDSFADFRDAVLEAFSPRPGKKAIFRYGYREAGLDFKSEINALAGYEYTHDKDFAYGYLYKGMRINASINESWRMRSLWYSGAFFGDAWDSIENSPLVDGFYKTKERSIWVDNLRADISYISPRFYASLGREKFQVGNSISGSIILSANSNEYGYFLAEGSFGRFRLSLLHGTLIADETLAIYNDSALANSKHYPDKYLALHQITYSVKDRLELFFGESLIYGDRGMDVNYLLPQAFWRATEHNLQDRDNILIFGGINYRPRQQTTLYAHAIIDEMRYSEILGNWWGNKWAFQSGVAQSFGRDQKGRLGFEFTAVRPWIYTHFLPYASYSHDNQPLGYPKGANLVDYTVEAV
ncbi:MAG: hypothetical protein U1C33_03440, partial [Candidatus Cloacimonadaceae bacterium]|nr:hypothetical protein [Candidatus Cloacimonadaceae bacterium]